MNVLALDIGGANIKAADSARRAESFPFALWKDPDRLSRTLSEVIDRFDESTHLGVTMTGELCDCFETRSEGVRRILDAVEAAGGARFGENKARVWTTEARFVSIDEARADPKACAAANWLALATHVARSHPDDEGLLVDIGSTTTDVVAFRSGEAIPIGLDDTSRLTSGELVYRGVRRTPLSSVLQAVALGADVVPLAAELFATTLDAFLVRGDLSPAPDDHDTADGRPATPEHAKDRLARAICLDPPDLTESDAFEIALQITSAVSGLVRDSIDRVSAARSLDGKLAIVSGSGEFLAQRCAGRSFERVVSLSDVVGEPASAAACAFALTRLLPELELNATP